jgi:hypothetical protein
MALNKVAKMQMADSGLKNMFTNKGKKKEIQQAVWSLIHKLDPKEIFDHQYSLKLEFGTIKEAQLMDYMLKTVSLGADASVVIILENNVLEATLPLVVEMWNSVDFTIFHKAIDFLFGFLSDIKTNMAKVQDAQLLVSIQKPFTLLFASSIRYLLLQNKAVRKRICMICLKFISLFQLEVAQPILLKDIAQMANICDQNKEQALVLFCQAF